MKKLFTLLTLALNVSIYAQPGAIDSTFSPGTAANDAVYVTAVQSDGKILIGGNFTSYNGTTRNFFARLLSDGSLDSSFNSDIVTNHPVQSIALQSNGKIIVGGQFYDYNNPAARNRIARLKSNGILDSTFNPGTGANGTIYNTTLQSDGKIIIGGDFTTINGTTRNRIDRLNTDGSLDLSFTSGTGANNTVYANALQSDGKIIIGGYFNSYNGTARKSIARLNANGTLDTTFNPGTGANNIVRSIALQTDGKIIIAGDFIDYNGTSIKRIARLYPDGSLDTTFNPGTGASWSIQSMNLQRDGKIIIAGSFTTFNGTARNYIARLKPNGSLDNTFNIGTGADNNVLCTTLQSDGKIIIGGDFTSYNGTTRNKVARVLGDTLPPCTITAHFTLYPDNLTPGNWWALNQAIGANPLTFMWYWGDGDSTSGPTPSHAYSSPGNYDICLTVSDTTGCTVTYCDSSTYIFKTDGMIQVNVVYQIPTGISSVGIPDAALRIMPNPATNQLRLYLSGQQAELVRIYNLDGKLVSENKQPLNNHIDISQLSQGVYVAEVSYSGAVQRVRWVKM